MVYKPKGTVQYHIPWLLILFSSDILNGSCGSRFISHPTVRYVLVHFTRANVELSHEKNPCYFPLYWLVNRDPYNVFFYNPNITG